MTEQTTCSEPAKRVMIVDDSELAIRLLQAELEGKGLEVVVADSAEVATTMLLKKSTRPHLILLDVNMPGIDGEQFCRFIKSNAMFSDIKVIFCSGMDGAKLRALTEACRADGCVHKDEYLGKWVSEQCG